MAIIQCGECGAQISDKAAVCVHCGAPVAPKAQPAGSPALERRNTPPPPPERVGGPLWLWVVGSIAVVVGLASLAPRDPQAEAESEARWRAEKAIDLCWEEQERKSISPATQRFIAGACEISEEEYFKKYGRYHTRYGKKP